MPREHFVLQQHTYFFSLEANCSISKISLPFIFVDGNDHSHYSYTSQVFSICSKFQVLIALSQLFCRIMICKHLRVTKSRRGHTKQFAALFVVLTMKYKEVTMKYKACVAVSFLDMDLNEKVLLREEETGFERKCSSLLRMMCLSEFSQTGSWTLTILFL